MELKSRRKISTIFFFFKSHCNSCLGSGIVIDPVGMLWHVSGGLVRAWRGWREAVTRAGLAGLQEALKDAGSAFASAQASARMHGALRGLVRVVHAQVSVCLICVSSLFLAVFHSLSLFLSF